MDRVAAANHPKRRLVQIDAYARSFVTTVAEDATQASHEKVGFTGLSVAMRAAVPATHRHRRRDA